MEGLTINEIMAELEKHFSPAEDGFTMVELCEELGRPRSTMIPYIRRWIRDGRLQPTKVTRVKVNGVVALIDGYRWTGEGRGL